MFENGEYTQLYWYVWKICKTITIKPPVKLYLESFPFVLFVI